MKKIFLASLTLFFLSLISYSQIKVDSQGRVGLSTTSPSEDVDIEGEVEIEVPSYLGCRIFIRSNNGYTPDFYPEYDSQVDLGQSSKPFDDIWTGTLHYGSLQQTSDINAKENLAQVNITLDKLIGLNAIRFDYREDFYYKSNFDFSSFPEHYNRLEKRRINHFGFSAQEVQKEFPELVEEQEDGMLSINYVEFIPLIINALKEQQEQISVLQQIVIEQRNEISDLKQ